MLPVSRKRALETPEETGGKKHVGDEDSVAPGDFSDVGAPSEAAYGAPTAPGAFDPTIASVPLTVAPSAYGIGPAIVDPSLIEPSVQTYDTVDTKTDPSNQMTLRVLLSARSIGCIIGKGGAQINEFRTQTGAHISADKQVPNATKRIVTAKGTVEQVIAVLCSMADKLANRSKGNKAEGLPAVPGDTATGDSRYQITLLVHNHYVGSIMGKSGARIATIRASTGANIKISEKPLDDSSEKTIAITGSAEEVNKAINAICMQIMEAMTTESRGNAHAAVVPYVPKPEYAGGNPMLMGGQLGYGAAFGSSPGFPGVPGAPGFSSQFGAASSGFASDPFAMTPQSLIIPVPDNMCGSVIGRGGSMISSIRQRSGANIKISDSKKGGGVTGSNGERQITVTGTKQQNEVAVALIYEILNGTGAPAMPAAPSVPSAAAGGAYPNYMYGALSGLSLGLGGLGTASYGSGVPPPGQPGQFGSYPY